MLPLKLDIMVPPADRNKDASKGRGSKGKKNKSKQKTKANEKTATRPTTGGIQRLDNGGMKKMPSNAPTMAIAPSDYEHIFHEGQGSPTTMQDVGPSPPVHPTTLPPTPVPGVLPGIGAAVQSPRLHFAGGPVSPSPPPIRPYPEPQLLPPPQQPDAPLQVSPDGYTLLGQIPDESNRRVALPPHIVRASNQFSRSAMLRISAYLATRAHSFD